MPDIPYALVSSAIRIRAKEVTTIDKYGLPQNSTRIEDLQVELVHRAAAGPSRLIRSDGKGDQELSVQLTADGRLRSIEYKATGVGGAVVTAGAKVLAFVAGIAQAAVRMGRLAGEDSGSKTSRLDPRRAWAQEHPDEASQLDTNRALATKTAATLAQVRDQIVEADDVVKLRNLSAREQTLEATLHTVRTEIGRIEDLYQAWREGQRTTSSATIERLVDLERIPLRQENNVPDRPRLEGDLSELWTELGVLIEMVDTRRPASSAPAAADRRDSQGVQWRIPRPVELSVWKRTPERSTLVSRSVIRIVDTHSETHSMEMRTSIFGAHGGSWTFNDDGSPAALKLQHESAVGAFASALASVPGAVVESVEQATKFSDAWSGIQDAAAEREKAAAERDLATARARLELVGLHATADDFAALRRVEQAAKLRTATQAISPSADAVDDLKRQLELVSTQNKIDDLRRAALLEADLAEMKAEVAQLDLEVKAAKAQFARDHSGGDSGR